LKSLKEPEAIFRRWRESAPRPLFWTVNLWLWATVIYLVLHLASGLRIPLAILDFSLLLTAVLLIMIVNWMVVVKLWNWTHRRVSKGRDG